MHRSAWPKAETYAAAAFKASPELLTHAGEALAALRGIKSKAKVSMKTPILSVKLGVSDEVRGFHRARWPISPKPGRVVGRISFVAPQRRPRPSRRPLKPPRMPRRRPRPSRGRNRCDRG